MTCIARAKPWSLYDLDLYLTLYDLYSQSEAVVVEDFTRVDAKIISGQWCNGQLHLEV